MIEIALPVYDDGGLLELNASLKVRLSLLASPAFFALDGVLWVGHG